MSDAPLSYVEVNPSQPPTSCVIWLHGLGDSGHGFAPIVPEFHLPDTMAVRFIFPHAPERPITINNNMRMRAWYDIKSLDFKSRADKEGVCESAALVEQLIEAEISRGIPANRILLAGFSQGGVIALHLSTRCQYKLAGVMALSTYMNDSESLAQQATDANKDTEFMVAHGSQDEVVPMAMGKAAYDALTEQGFNASWKTYPMQHNVCGEEVADIAAFLCRVFA
jgi:phospholipase/carboxylesterase